MRGRVRAKEANMVPVKSDRPFRQWLATIPRRETPTGEKCSVKTVKPDDVIPFKLGVGDRAEFVGTVTYSSTKRERKGTRDVYGYEAKCPAGSLSFLCVKTEKGTIVYKCNG